MSWADYETWERQRNLLIPKDQLPNYIKCESKQKHETFKAAKVAARGYVDLHPYKCNLCNKWHIGSKRNVVQKK